MSDILLITPPFTQLNTPYPATAYLKGFLNTKDISTFQMDLGIEVILSLFSKDGLTSLFKAAGQLNQINSENSVRINALQKDYIATIDPIIQFLQGKNSSLARQICTRNFLPEAGRFSNLEDIDWSFGNMGLQDKAKHFCTLYLEDISDFIADCVDENFGFSQYAERLGRSANNFDELYQQLTEELTFIDEITLSILENNIQKKQPKLVCISVPFPGNLFSAFRCAQYIKTHFPAIKVSMGGGFPNTELRSLTDKRVFEFFDYISLDDGELPVELIFQSLTDSSIDLKRTFHLKNDHVFYNNTSQKSDYKQSELGTPDYTDLFLTEYISVIGIVNPMHSLWSDGRWNKLTMAHGCYWGKCTFCDISLDYIKIYEPIAAKMIVDRMEEMINLTNENGFHFVDEAAPPALMRAVALEILKRDLVVSWWTNIRFEKSFTKELCLLLKSSGCIAVSGGLEVASDRLLKLIDKGVTVKQVAQVTQNLAESGIMVHAFLMYGYPSQTIQETIDSLEMVRQMFEAGILQSGFWHQFALTAHSPIGLNPDKYGIKPDLKPISFADNDVQFKDNTGINHDMFSYGLKKSLYNFMNEVGYDVPSHEWFDFKVPKTTINRNYIQSCLIEEMSINFKPNSQPKWLAGMPITQIHTKTKRNETWELMKFQIHSKNSFVEISIDKEIGLWLQSLIEKISIHKTPSPTLAEIKKDFENSFENFELFWYSKPLMKLRENHILIH